MTHHNDPTPKPKLIELDLPADRSQSVQTLAKDHPVHIEGYIEKGKLVVTNLNIAATTYGHAWNVKSINEV